MPNVILKKFLEVECNGVEYKVRKPKHYKDFKKISRNFFKIMNVAINKDMSTEEKQAQVDELSEDQYQLIAPLCYDISNLTLDTGERITTIQDVFDLNEPLAYDMVGCACVALVEESNDLKKNLGWLASQLATGTKTTSQENDVKAG